MNAINIPKIFPPCLLAGVFLSSCGAFQESAYVADGVYYEEVEIATSMVDRVQHSADNSNDTYSSSTDDYYDPKVANQVERNYYDMTYRDPQYYNMSRFGWNSAAWGMSMGNPIGMGYGGFYNSSPYWGGGASFYGYDPFMNGSFYSNPYMSPYYNGGWGNSYFGGYSPSWMYPGNYYGGSGWNNYYDPYSGYYSPGYYGPGGSYYCPGNIYGGISTAGSVYYGHRNAMNAFNSSGPDGSTDNSTPRIRLNDPIRLMRPTEQTRDTRPSPTRNNSEWYRPNENNTYESRPGNNGRLTAPAKRPPSIERPSKNNNEQSRPTPAPSRDTTSPSRSSGSSRSTGGRRRR